MEEGNQIKGVYGPNDKPKGTASVVADDPIVDIFPVDNGEIDKPEQPSN
jgi:hypothetical protein